MLCIPISNPRRVAVVGAGTGAVRRSWKHSSVEKVVLAEIDEAVIEAARRYLPSISSALDDPRVDIMVGDGIAHIKARRGAYDVVIVDSTEPVGAAVGLFSREFYQAIYEALTEDGVLVAQTESPIVNASLIEQSFRHIRALPHQSLYLACVDLSDGLVELFPGREEIRSAAGGLPGEAKGPRGLLQP